MPIQFKKLLQIRSVKLTLELALIFIIFFAVQALLQRNMAKGVAPAISGTLLDGRHFTLQAPGTRPLLLHFWASWCGICKLEQDSIEAISRDHTVISIAINSGDADEVRQYLQQHQLTFPVLNDPDGEIAQRYGIRGVPSSFIIDRSGRIVFSETGYTTAWGLRARLWWAGNRTGD